MKSTGRIFAACLVGALLGFAAPSLADDDLVGLKVGHPVRIGNLTLQPGDYLLRAEASQINHSLVRVTSLDETKFYGYVLAHMDCSWKMRSNVDKFVFDPSNDQVLQTWVVRWKEAGYTFSPAPVSAEMTARAQKKFEARTAAK